MDLNDISILDVPIGEIQELESGTTYTADRGATIYHIEGDAYFGERGNVTGYPSESDDWDGIYEVEVNQEMVEQKSLMDNLVVGVYTLMFAPLLHLLLPTSNLYDDEIEDVEVIDETPKLGFFEGRRALAEQAKEDEQYAIESREARERQRARDREYMRQAEQAREQEEIEIMEALEDSRIDSMESLLGHPENAKYRIKYA